MSQGTQDFFGRIPFFYRFRSRIQVYIANLRVRYSFGGKVFGGLFSIMGSILGITASLAILVWFFSHPPTVGDQKTLPQVSVPLSHGVVQAPPPSAVEEVLPPKEEEKHLDAVPPLTREETPLGSSATPEIMKEEAELQKEELLPMVSGPKETEEVKPFLPPPLETKTEIYMRTKADLVNLRTHAYLESDVLARLDANYIVRVLEIRGDWVKTDAGEGIVGWIYKDLLEEVSFDAYEAWSQNGRRSSARQILRRDLDDPSILTGESLKIKELVLSWKTAWEAKDIKRYMGFYSKSFTTSKHNWETYREYKENVFKAAHSIVVEISDIQVKWENYTMVASFIQDYRSNTLNSKRGKSLYFHQEGNDWKIIREGVVGEQGG